MSDLPQSQPLTCAVCGSPLEPDDRFCRFCGATVGSVSVLTDPDQETRQTPVVDAAADELWLPPGALAGSEAVEDGEALIIEPAQPAADVDDLWLPASATPAPTLAEAEVEAVVIEETIYAPEPAVPTDEEPIYAAPPPPPVGPPTPVGAAPYAAPPPVEQPTQGSKRIWWIIGGIVLFFFLVCCCLAIGIAAVASADSGFQDELRGTAGLLLAML